MANTTIEWTLGDDGTPGKSWNFVRGCERVDEGCRNCFAEQIAARFSGEGQPYEGLANMTPTGPRWTRRVLYLPDRLLHPLSWRKPSRVFVDSMSDLFHRKVPDRFIAAAFAVMAATPQHTYIILTKRPERGREWFRWIEGHGHINGSGVTVRQACRRYLSSVGLSAAGSRRGGHLAVVGERQEVPEDEGTAWPLPNVWLLTSVSDQPSADVRIPELLECSAAVRGVSYEPALGPVTFGPWLGNDVTHVANVGGGRPPSQHYELRPPRLHWVIAGAESGPRSRPSEIAWFQDVRDQCAEAGTPFFLKQIAKEGGPRGKVEKVPELDGVQHMEWPS